MIKEPIPFKHQDLTRNILPSEGRVDWKPSAAYTPDVVAYRRGRVHGLLLREFETNGIRICQRLVSRPSDSDAFVKVAKELAPSCMVTAFHNLVERATTQRCEAYMPAMTDEAGQRLGLDDLQQIATEQLSSIVTMSERVEFLARGGRSSTLERNEKMLGRAIGGLGVTLAAAQADPERMAEATPFDAQLLVRESGLAVIGSIPAITESIGAHPTLAQLADPYSNVVVGLQRRPQDPMLRDYLHAAVDLTIAA